MIERFFDNGISTYVIDSLSLKKIAKDSLQHRAMYSFEDDAGLYSVGDKTTQQYNSQEKPKNEGHEGISRLFTLEQDDGIFALLLISFFLFSQIYKGGASFFKENLRLLFSTHKNVNHLKETVAAELWVNTILIFQTILISSIILFDIFLETDKDPLVQNSFVTIVLFMLAIATLLAFKYWFYQLLGYLFDIKEQIALWIRSYVIVLELLGIIGLIPALILVYSQTFHQALLVFFAILFVLSRLILFYRIIAFFFKTHVNFLFLIAYLCSLEIIPYVIIYQVLVYLYKVDIISLL